MKAMSRVKVFISYASKDQEAPISWIQKLEDSLHKIGFDVTYDVKLKKTTTVDIEVEMRDQIQFKNDFILTVITQKYFEQSEKPNSGVAKEIRLMAPLLNHDTNKNKIILIKRCDKCKVPNFLNNILYYNFSDDSKYEKNVLEVINRINNGFNVKVNNQQNLLLNLREYLESNNFIVQNIADDVFSSNNSILFYPVVVRKNINIIHKAQLELFLFLAERLKWSFEIMIYESSYEVTPTEFSKKFQKVLEAYISTKKLINKVKIKYSFSCSYFNLGLFGKKSKLEFERLMSILTLDELNQIILKNYPEAVKKNKLSKTLKEALRPIQIMAITSQISVNRKKQIVVLAGKDEENQWRIIYNLNSEKIGAILIPTLELEPKHYVVHDNLTKEDIASVHELKNNWSRGNFLEWVLQIFVALNEDKFEKNLFQVTRTMKKRKPKLNIDSLDQLTKQVWTLIRQKH